MDAQKIYQEQIDSWGEDKDIYLVTREEFIALLSSGSGYQVELDNQTASDGTQLSSLVYKGKIFCTTEPESLD